MKAGFLDGERGPLFYIAHSPQGATRGCVLYVHPFAEEHNKSRRMAAEQARRLAEQGFVVLMPDLFGCGDSAGDFGDAEWLGWKADLSTCLAWLYSNYPGPVALWGLRTGCLLISELFAPIAAESATQAASTSIAPAATVFWQPVVNGELFLTQFLRLRMAAGMMGGNKETTKDLRTRLTAGESLEVAGYTISPALAADLAAARLQAPPVGAVHWLEVAASPSADLPPVSRKLVDDWCARGIDVRSASVAGEAFWSTQEIREAPALFDRTLTALLEGA